MNTKGQKTKEQLLKNSRELFYQYGYTNTTLRMIAAKSNTNLGLFQYHFNGKHDIARIIYCDIRKYFENQLKLAQPSLSGRDMFFLSSAIEFYLCLGNENFAHFFSEYLNDSPMIEDTRFQHIEQFMKEQSSSVNSSKYAVYNAICLTAIKPALVNYTLSSSSDLDINELVCYYLHQQLHYAGLDLSLADYYISVLNQYYFNLTTNFTPVFTKLL